MQFDSQKFRQEFALDEAGQLLFRWPPSPLRWPRGLRAIARYYRLGGRNLRRDFKSHYTVLTQGIMWKGGEWNWNVATERWERIDGVE